MSFIGPELVFSPSTPIPQCHCLDLNLYFPHIPQKRSFLLNLNLNGPHPPTPQEAKPAKPSQNVRVRWFARTAWLHPACVVGAGPQLEMLPPPPSPLPSPKCQNMSKRNSQNGHWPGLVGVSTKLPYWGIQAGFTR